MRLGSLTYTGLTEMVQEKLHGVAMVTIEQLFHSLQLLLLCLSGKRGRVAEGVTQQLPAVCTRTHNNEAPYHSSVHMQVFNCKCQEGIHDVVWE